MKMKRERKKQMQRIASESESERELRSIDSWLECNECQMNRWFNSRMNIEWNKCGMPFLATSFYHLLEESRLTITKHFDAINHTKNESQKLFPISIKWKPQKMREQSHHCSHTSNVFTPIFNIRMQTIF